MPNTKDQFSSDVLNAKQIWHLLHYHSINGMLRSYVLFLFFAFFNQLSLSFNDKIFLSSHPSPSVSLFFLSCLSLLSCITITLSSLNL